MRLFDTHAHLDDPRFDEDRPQVLERMRVAGVERCVCVGADLPTSKASCALAEQHDFLFFSAGVHPHEASSWKEEDASAIRELLAHPKAVALGEIGLDYHYDLSPKTDQRSVFITQLEMAAMLRKTAILHVREAHGDTLEILTQRKQALPLCIVHCYSGSWESAMQYLDLGCYISLPGTVTFKNANKLLQVARNVPLERLLVETDCPYLAPVPHRGKRNEPAFVADVARYVADLREMAAEELAEATFRNACKAYGVS